MTVAALNIKTEGSFSASKFPSSVPIGDGIHKHAKHVEQKLGFLPQRPRNYLGSVFLAGSLLGAFQQSFQQILIDLIPKSVIGGAFRALPNPNNPAVNSSDYSDQDKPTLAHILSKLFSGHYLFNGNVAIDEAVVELLEYLGVYFLPTIFATGFASQAIGKITGLDFEFFGQPTHKYLENIGKKVELGTLSKKQLLVNKSALSKLALGKTMLYAMTTIFCASIAFIIPSIRAFIVNKILGISDYSKLLGYQDTLEQDKDFNSLQNSASLIKKGLTVAFASIPLLLGATWFMNKRIESSPKMQNFFKRASMHFDLDKNFGLSRIFVAPTIMTAAVGYILGSRGSAEKIETFNRAFLWAAPAVIFYKQVITSVFAGLTSLLYGVGDVHKLFPMIGEKVKKGERDFLDWNFLKDFSYDKKSKEYDGLITKLKGFEKLEAKQKERFLGSMKFINSWVPYLFALFVGATVNLHNLQKIWELHQQDKSEDSANSAASEDLTAVNQSLAAA